MPDLSWAGPLKHMKIENKLKNTYRTCTKNKTVMAGGEFRLRLWDERNNSFFVIVQNTEQRQPGGCCADTHGTVCVAWSEAAQEESQLTNAGLRVRMCRL